MTVEPCTELANARVLRALANDGLDARVGRYADGTTSTNTLTVQIDGVPYQLTLAKTIGERATNVKYVRWSTSQARELEVHDPLPDTHQAYNEPCLWCRNRLGNGLLVALFVLGPVNDESRKAHHAGKEYAALAAYGHAICIYGVPSSPTE